MLKSFADFLMTVLLNSKESCCFAVLSRLSEQYWKFIKFPYLRGFAYFNTKLKIFDNAKHKIINNNLECSKKDITFDE